MAGLGALPEGSSSTCHGSVTSSTESYQRWEMSICVSWCPPPVVISSVVGDKGGHGHEERQPASCRGCREEGTTIMHRITGREDARTGTGFARLSADPSTKDEDPTDTTWSGLLDER